MAEGILGPFTPQLTAPDPTLVPIDAGTNGLIQGSVDRSLQPTSAFAESSNRGVQDAANSAHQTDQQLKQENAQLGGGSDAINSAIRNQYNTQSGSEVKRLLDANDQAAEFRKSQALQVAATQAMARQNVSVQAYGMLMQSYNATEAARAQMLNSILGAGGTAVGTAAGRRRKSSGAMNIGASQGPIPGDEGETINSAGTSGNYGNIA